MTFLLLGNRVSVAATNTSLRKDLVENSVGKFCGAPAVVLKHDEELTLVISVADGHRSEFHLAGALGSLGLLDVHSSPRFR